VVQPGSRLDALTALRFLAAVTIVIHHSRDTFIPADWIAGMPLDSAVSFFFVLSGFILTYTYPELPSARHVGKFWLARFARLWPVHIATLVLTSFTVPTTRIVDPLVLASNVAMVQAWVPLPAFFFSGNAVSWSIATEWGFYALFPLLILSFRTNWPLKLFFAALMLYILVRISSTLPDYSADYRGPSNFGVLYFSPLARLSEFLVGMCVALSWRAVRPRLDSNVFLWTAAEVAAVLLFVAYVLFGRSYVLSVATQHGSAAFLVWFIRADLVPCFAIIMFVMASGTGIIGRLLACRPCVYLGEVSFCIYMLHAILIANLKNSPEIMALPVAVKFSLLTACVIGASMLAYHLIE
jgi:peptidoglycan/LPS O-acetylase OafA/YrhL